MISNLSFPKFTATYLSWFIGAPISFLFEFYLVMCFVCGWFWLDLNPLKILMGRDCYILSFAYFLKTIGGVMSMQTQVVYYICWVDYCYSSTTFLVISLYLTAFIVWNQSTFFTKSALFLYFDLNLCQEFEME